MFHNTSRKYVFTFIMFKIIFAQFPLVYIYAVWFKLSAMVTLFFFWWHFCMVEILWWNLVPYSSLDVSGLCGEKSKWEWKECIFIVTLHCNILMLEAFAGASVCNYILCDGPQICQLSIWMLFHCVFSGSSWTSSKFLSFVTYIMCGSTKVLSFIFVSLILGIICCRY